MNRLLHFFVTIALVVTATTAFAQTTIYSQNFGTGTALPAGWTAGGAAAANMQVSTASPSSTYTTPISFSAGSNLSDGATSPVAGTATMTVSGLINTSNYTNIKVIYGARGSSASYTAAITFEWSSDGTNWNTITYSNVTYNGNWALVNGGTPITLPVGAENQANLRFRWTFVRANTSGNYRIDDFTVLGTVNAACTTPDPVTGLTATSGNTASLVSWTNGTCYDQMMVVVSNAAFTSAVPTGDGSAYTASATNSFTDATASTFDGGKVLYKGTGPSFTAAALTNGTTYNVKVFVRKGTNWTNGQTTTTTPVGPSPAVSVTPSSLTLTTSSGNPSLPSSYTVSGSNLSGNVTVTAPTGVQIASSYYGTYGSTLTLTPSAGTLANTTVYVRLTGAAFATGTITNASTGATTQNVTVNGTVSSVTATEILSPQYIQGLSGSNSNRVPYVFRATLSGLSANATYRYFPGVVDSTAAATASGAGNPIFVDNQSGFTQSGGGAINTAGSYSTFTTNAGGSYTGWFAISPTGNGVFTTGDNIYIRINLNNGAGGTSVANRITLPSPIKVQDLVAGRAQPLFSISSGFAKNFVMIYDNTGGSGRPIAGATIEDDGATPASYAGFYNSQVNAVAGAWGTIIPSGLPNGIRRIEQRDFATGNVIGCASDADGVWPTGSVNTVNPAGGTAALQIANADAPLTCCLGGSTATVTLSVSTNTGFESNTTVVTVTATACTAVTGAQTVQITTSGTATNGSDYTLSGSTITIPNGNTTGSITFTVVNDASVEGSEAVTLTLGSPSSGLVLGAPSAQTISIVDDDVPIATLTSSTINVNESAAPTVTLTVTTDVPTLNDETFTLVYTGTATAGTDYIASTTTVTIPTGSTTATATFTVTNDIVREANENVIITLTTSSTSVGIGAPNSQTVAINDDDDAIPLTSMNVTSATSTFDELASTGSGISFLTNMPRGAYFAETGSNANTTYRTDNGNTSTGDTYSYGASAASDRAMGSLTSGGVTPAYVALKFKNNTGSAVNAIKVNYYGEQWRTGANGFTGTNRDRLAFEYSTDATDATSGTWSPAPQLNFYAPVTTGSAGSLNGNTAANRTNVVDTVFVGSVPNSATFWVRWKDIDVVGSDDGLSVDDANFTPIFFTPTVYYSKATGDLNDVNTWGNQTDGNGLSPANFTANGQTFYIANQTDATISSNWTVSGTGSKVVVTTGTAFTVPAMAAFVGMINVDSAATLVLQNATSPTFGTLHVNSTVVFGADAPVSQAVSSGVTFGNLTFTGSGTHVIGSSLRVANQLLLDNGTMGQNNVANFYVIYFQRDLLVNAGIAYTSLYNSNVSLQPYGAFKQTVSAVSNVVNASRFLMNVNNAGGSLITSGQDLKTDTLQLSSGTVVKLTHLKLNTNANAFFIDNGDTIKVTGDVEAAGTTANYNLTGTIELNGAAGTSNFRQDNATGATAVIKAQLNNVLVNTSGTNDVKFQPTTGSAAVTVNGDLTFGGTSTGKIRFYGNTYNLKGNVVNMRTVDAIDQNTSTFAFNGIGDQSFTTAFAAGDTLYKVTVNKSSGAVDLNGTLVVSNTYTGVNGLLNTNASKVVLGNTATIVENDSAYIKGSVWTTRVLNQNVNNTFGGLGIEINALNLVPGSTLVKRTTGVSLPLGCFVSVKRQFDIFPTVNNNMNATVKINYLEDPELNGLDENFLRLFQYPNGTGPWTVNYNATINPTNNYVITTGVQSLDRYTLANPNPAAGTAVASGGTASSPGKVVCSGSSTSLSLTGSLGNIQWQQSADGNTNWTDIAGATNTAYNTPSLSTATYYRAVVTNPCYSIASNTVPVTISATPLVTVTNVTDHSVTVSWTPFVAGQYNVSWTGAGTGTQANVTAIPFTIPNLQPNQNVTVVVTKAAPACSGTSTGSVTTKTLCGTPLILTAVPITVTSGGTHQGIRVTWSPVVGATQYRLYYRALQSGGTWSTVDTAGTQKTVLPLYTGAPYAFMVAANNCPVAGQLGQLSAIYYGQNAGCPAPLPNQPGGAYTNGAPTCGVIPNVCASSSCPNQITVNVTGGSGPWRITLRRLTPSLTSGVLYTTAAATTNFTIGSQFSSAIFEVWAQSICPSGISSAISNVVTVTVKATCPPVENVVVSKINCHGFAATWNASACSIVTGYYMYIQSSTGGWVAYNAGNANAKVLNWLAPNTYHFYVRSTSCNGAVSVASPIQTVVVPPCRGDEQEVSNAAEDTDAHPLNNPRVNVFPNPTTGTFNVVMSDPAEGGVVSVQLIDALGSVMLENVAVETSGPTQFQLQMPENAAAGIYFVRTTVNGKPTVNRIVYYK